jgi:hypothetical protein
VGAAEVTPGSSGNNRRYGFDGQNGRTPGVGLDEAQRGAGARLGAGLRAQPERRRRRAPPLRAAHQGAASRRGAGIGVHFLRTRG